MAIEEVHDAVAQAGGFIVIGQINVQRAVFSQGRVDKVPFYDHSGHLPFVDIFILTLRRGKGKRRIDSVRKISYIGLRNSKQEAYLL
jgi:hypothetical protein